MSEVTELESLPVPDWATVETLHVSNGCVFATVTCDSGARITVRPVDMEAESDHLITAVDYRGHEMEPFPVKAERVSEEVAEVLYIINEPYEDEYTLRVHMMVEALWGEKARRDYERVVEANRPYGMTTSGVAQEHGVEPIPETDNIAWGMYHAGKTLNSLERDDTDEYSISLPESAEDFKQPEYFSFVTEPSETCGETAVTVIDGLGKTRAKARPLYTSSGDQKPSLAQNPTETAC